MKDSQISALLTPILAQFALELDALEIVPAGKRRLLRIVVDGDGPEGRGPLLDDIASASRACSLALDASTAVGSAAYTLEVSSRGVSRPLERPAHWRRNRGRLVAVTLAGGDKVTGRIVSGTDDGVVLDVDGTDVEVAFDEVTKALVQVELNRPRDSGPEDEDDLEDEFEDDDASDLDEDENDEHDENEEEKH